MRPVELPAVRTALRDFAGASTQQGNDRENAQAEQLVRALDAAELYWISPAMAELAADVAHRDIHEMRWLQEDRPAPCGVMLVDGRTEGIGDLPVWRSGRTAPAHGVIWGPHPDGMLLSWLITRADAEHLLGHRLLPKQVPPLLVGGGLVMPVEGDYRAISTVSPPLARAPLALIQSAWLLMDMPGITTTSTTPPAAATHAAATAGATHTEPTVTVIQIRRQHPDGHGTADPHWHHRWVVRLHKRWQACGPARSEHRRILIAPHIKGPAGAPLLHREHVTAWVR